MHVNLQRHGTSPRVDDSGRCTSHATTELRSTSIMLGYLSESAETGMCLVAGGLRANVQGAWEAQGETDVAKYGRKAQQKVKRAMHERKRGTLKSGRSGKRVTSRKQAIAIGLSEARRAGGKVPRRKKSSGRKRSGRRSRGRASQ